MGEYREAFELLRSYIDEVDSDVLEALKEIEAAWNAKPAEPPAELLDALQSKITELEDARAIETGMQEFDRGYNLCAKNQIDFLSELLTPYTYIEEPCPECRGCGGKLIKEETGVIDPSTQIKEVVQYAEPCPNCTNGKVGRWVKG